MKTKKIKAKVSQELLKNTSFLFNQSPNQTIQELLQNCRRAGATKVEITIQESGDYSKISILDNGRGIENPEDLLHLGKTGWDEPTKGLECPAGMGFFSLCHLDKGVTVESKNWEVHIDKHTFQGNSEAEIIQHHSTYGTKISFYLKIPSNRLLEIIKGEVEYYPIKTIINGTEVARKEFLEHTSYIKKIPGGRIGVRDRKYKDCINFHGLVIDFYHTLPETILPLDMNYSIWLDIEDNKMLDLVLPTRREVVNNNKLTDLSTECRRAIYEYILNHNKEHKLPFKYYQEAHSMGVKIPEAKAELKLCLPRPLFSRENDWIGNIAENYKINQEVNKESLLSGALSKEDIIALHLSDQKIPLIYWENKLMEGYSWYPEYKVGSSLLKITPAEGKGKEFFSSIEDPKDELIKLCENNTDKSFFPKKVEIKLTFIKKREVIPSDPSREKESLSIPICIAFHSEKYGETGAEIGWIPTQGEESKEKIDVNTLNNLFFSFDADGDCYETQEIHFNSTAESTLINVFKGEEEAAMHDLEEALDNFKIRHALSRLKATGVDLTIDQKSRILTIKKLHR